MAQYWKRSRFHRNQGANSTPAPSDPVPAPPIIGKLEAVKEVPVAEVQDTHGMKLDNPTYVQES